MADPGRIGLDWPLTSVTGWGVVGLYLALSLCRMGGALPVLLRPPQVIDIDPLRRHLLRPHLKAAEDLNARFPRAARPVIQADFPVLHALGNDFAAQPIAPGDGQPNIGLAVLESTRVSAEGRAHAGRYARIVSASRWVSEMVAGAGIADVTVVHQGVEPALFHPGPKGRPFGDRFVVFSGGKIEYRKAQDLVAIAFRRFHERHPDSILVTCWQNPWPDLAATILYGGIVRHAPARRDGLGVDVDGWMAGLGLAPGSFLDIDFVPNGQMPAVVREADAAVFPNRCEGGTNLIAMECMAAGVPTVLSANTGHLDLLAGPDVALPLRRQRPARRDLAIGTDGWGESDVDEIVDALESIYTDRAAAAARAARAAAWMAEEWSWDRHAERLLTQIRAVA